MIVSLLKEKRPRCGVSQTCPEQRRRNDTFWIEFVKDIFRPRTMPKNQMKENKIHEFKTIREKTAFWDSYDVTDYFEEMEFVTGTYLPQAGERKKVMTIRFAPSLKERVEQVARSYVQLHVFTG